MKKEISKSQQKLLDFGKFCDEHPELRFWQALREWSESDYILKAHANSSRGGERAIFQGVGIYLIDTYNEN